MWRLLLLVSPGLHIQSFKCCVGIVHKARNLQAHQENMPHKQQQNHFLVEVLQYMWNRCMSRGKKTQTVYTRCGYWYYLKTTNTFKCLKYVKSLPNMPELCVTWTIFHMVLIHYMYIPYSFIVKIKYNISPQGKWFMFYVLPLPFVWVKTSLTFSTEISHCMITIFVSVCLSHGILQYSTKWLKSKIYHCGIIVAHNFISYICTLEFDVAL